MHTQQNISTCINFPRKKVGYLANVVLHKCCSNVDLMTTPRIFTCLFKYISGCFDALSSATKLHVLYIYLYIDKSICAAKMCMYTYQCGLNILSL